MKFKNIYLAVKPNLSIENKKFLIELKKFLLDQGAIIQENLEKVDLIITFGGDGTILGIVRELKNFDAPIFGINAGNLGFLTSTNKENYILNLEEVFSGKYSEDKRMLLNVILESGSKGEKFVALNDAVVSHTGIAKVAKIAHEIGKFSFEHPPYFFNIS